MKNTNEYEKFIKQINRINTIRRVTRVLVRVLVLAIVFGGLGYWSGYKTGHVAGVVAGVEDLASCEASGSGYYINKNGDFVCIYD